jgi:hypothetical protein
VTVSAASTAGPHRGRWFIIAYAVLLSVCPTFMFMFVWVGTLSVAAWMSLSLRTDVVGGPLFALQVVAWATIEALVAFAFAAVATRVGASTRRWILFLGVMVALIAATRPIYCYFEGVNESRGACTSAISALWATF